MMLSEDACVLTVQAVILDRLKSARDPSDRADALVQLQVGF